MFIICALWTHFCACTRYSITLQRTSNDESRGINQKKIRTNIMMRIIGRIFTQICRNPHEYTVPGQLEGTGIYWGSALPGLRQKFEGMQCTVGLALCEFCSLTTHYPLGACPKNFRPEWCQPTNRMLVVSAHQL